MKIGLVVEGGGMKCAYSAGILDKFLDAIKLNDDYDDDDEYLPIDNEPAEAAEEKAADDAEKAGTASRKVKMAGLRPGCSCFLQSVVILIK